MGPGGRRDDGRFSFSNIKSDGTLIPGSPNPGYPVRVLSSEGRFSRALLKWDRAKAWPGRGNPSRSDAASAAVPRKRRLGGSRGYSSGPNKRLCHWMAGRGQAAAGNRRAARQPSRRKNGPLATNPAMERPKGAFVYYQGASFGAPSPLKVEGRKTKSPTRAAARGRERLAI